MSDGDGVVAGGSVLRGRRVLVVGASSGIGAAVVGQLADAGSAVAGAARRSELVPAGVRLSCDVRDPGACSTMVDAAVGALDGLDALVYAAAVAPLCLLAATTPDVWDEALRTNVVGASLVTAAALPQLAASPLGGVAVYLTSDSVPAPLPGLGAYAASKAALETLVRAWEAEQPNVRFHAFAVHPTMTPMADRWDPALAAELMPAWERAGLLDVTDVRDPADVATEIVALL